MLDSRRDCRYRLVAHPSIRVGLGIVAFHDVPGISSGGLGFLSPLFTRVCKKPVSRSIVPFSLSLGPSRACSLMGLRAEQTGATRPLEASLHAALAGNSSAIHRPLLE